MYKGLIFDIINIMEEVFALENSQGKASTRAKNKYNAANYDSLRIVVPKGRKADIEAFAKEQGESVNGLVNGLLRNAMGLTEEDWKKNTDDE
ncbi:MAG: hypothetical protein E7322_05600 [Clostridiales bacterium]|nr:hypothetical protein [Clostridiales bacterium]